MGKFAGVWYNGIIGILDNGYWERSGGEKKMGLGQWLKEALAPTYVSIDGLALPKGLYEQLVRDGFLGEGGEVRPFARAESVKLDDYRRKHGRLPASEINDILASSD